MNNVYLFLKEDGIVLVQVGEGGKVLVHAAADPVLDLQTDGREH